MKRTCEVRGRVWKGVFIFGSLYTVPFGDGMTKKEKVQYILYLLNTDPKSESYPGSTS